MPGGKDNVLAVYHIEFPMADPQHDGDAGITAEIMAVIEEAAAAYLGRPVRILSVRLHAQPEDARNTWADQGRSVLQTSHNLVQRGH
jgi:hypothetical protein